MKALEALSKAKICTVPPCGTTAVSARSRGENIQRVGRVGGIVQQTADIWYVQPAISTRCASAVKSAYVSILYSNCAPCARPAIAGETLPREKAALEAIDAVPSKLTLFPKCRWRWLYCPSAAAPRRRTLRCHFDRKGSWSENREMTSARPRHSKGSYLPSTRRPSELPVTQTPCPFEMLVQVSVSGRQRQG
jgi:hypothetical protein